MRVLVVDDEKVGRNGICFLLRELDENFEIYEAENGKNAVALLQQISFDILLTDIKMPFMNGLELSKESKRLQKELQIIIFSGYNDFAFAKQAIQYGVSDYVLKPVDPEEFREAMERVTANVTERKKLLEVKKQLYKIESSYYLQQYLRQGTAADLQKAGEFADISLWQNCSCLFVAESSAPIFAEDQQWFREADFQQSLHCLVYSLVLQDTRAAFLLGQPFPCSRRMLAQTAQQYLEKRSGQPVLLAFGGQLSGPEELTKTFRGLVRLLGSSADSDSHLLQLEAAAKPVHPDKALLTQMFEQLQESARRGDVALLWKSFYDMRSSFLETVDMPVNAADKFSVSTTLHLLWNTSAADSDSRSAVLEELYRAKTLPQVCALLHQSICAYERNSRIGQDSARADVNMVKAYISQHYDEDLSVEALAEKVYLSPGYLSVIFKKETGQNLNSYIRAYRLAQAKCLLETTNMKIVQVCQKTGFTNVSYFCKRFREHFGTSPHRFRMAENENE